MHAVGALLVYWREKVRAEPSSVVRWQKAWFLPAAPRGAPAARGAKKFARSPAPLSAGKKRGFCQLRLGGAPAARGAKKFARSPAPLSAGFAWRWSIAKLAR